MYEFDGTDICDELCSENEIDELDDDVYRATRMSQDEIERIDELWKSDNKEALDIEPYRATKNVDNDEIGFTEPYRAFSSSDIWEGGIDSSESFDVLGCESLDSLEEKFASEIEKMSFDDLVYERERLDELSQMSDMDIFTAYDLEQKGKYDSELFDELTNGVSKEALEYLKEGLINGTEEVRDYFQLNDNDEGNDEDSLVLSKRK